MLLIKIAGIICLISGAIGSCYFNLRKQRLHALMLREMKNSILRMYQKVYQLGIPLPVIIEEEVKKTTNEVSRFYQKLLEALNGKNESSLNEMICECGNFGRDNSSLKKEEWGLFIEALQVTFDRQQTGESRVLNSYLTSFEEMICENRKERQQERKVTLAMTMLGTAALLCVLI